MRALARWGITPLLAAPVGAWALGLGDIELQSNLNQPFRARITLSATPDELQGLRITLAGVDTFERYGIDRPGFLDGLEFRVTTERDGRSVIHVNSLESIVEPFVTLLLEATWPRGRTLREYTVLLDPPVLLPASAAPPVVRPAETRAPDTAAPAGPISRSVAPAPAPRPAAAESPAPAPAARDPSAPSAPSEPVPAPRPRTSAVAPGDAYGPVQRAETLWAIAERLRPAGVTNNQMMVAIYEANPEAFGNNMNLLRAGATLRLPAAAALDSLTVTAANAEVKRQADTWRNRAADAGGRLVLLPPPETAVARTPAPAPSPLPVPTPAPAPAPQVPATAPPASAADGSAADLDDARLVEVRNAELEALERAAADDAAVPADSESAAPGVELESEQVFADDQPREVAPAPAPAAPAPVVRPAASDPSLLSRVLAVVLAPFLWIGLGVAVLLLLSALWFARRRRAEPVDVTGRWDALESESDETQEARDATDRLRRQTAEQTIVVEEQFAEAPRRPEPPRRAAAPRPQPQPQPQPEPEPPKDATGDETVASQAVINLDQADAVAEADFHIAYGLYDQAAELVQKALDAAPGRRDLKLKLLEVFFMWGNKDAFLEAARGLRSDLGRASDPDWDKVVIMGRQICPDERLFTDATTGGGRVDVDLEAGDSPLDLAFGDNAAEESGSLDFNIEISGTRPTLVRPAAKAAPRDAGSDSLDIGARTAAGLEAALFEDQLDNDDTGRRTMPDISIDSLAVTQESRALDRPADDDWATMESPTLEQASDGPTVETPTLETPAARSATGVTRTLAIPRGRDAPTVEQPALASAGNDYTAEIDLDDLGLDVKDLEGLPGDLGDLPLGGGAASDTREQPALRADDALLSATGVTKVLVTPDEDDRFEGGNTATLLAPTFDDEDGTGAFSGTEVLVGRHALDDESGSTSLVKSLRGKDGVDLDLADLTAALHGADTAEQPRVSPFGGDVFGGGETPLDIDVGRDISSDDDLTGTQEVGPLDPQTMTEIGTKLDLARAYIDMGDPEGARSILEEVLEEGDSKQRREAQGLIDVLSA